MINSFLSLVTKKRIKIFDMNINSGAIAIADHGGHFGFEHHDFVTEALNEKYFKIEIFIKITIQLGYLISTMEKKASSSASFQSSKFTIKSRKFK